MQSGIFPLKEFNTWEAIAVKSYPILKSFIHEAYSRHLTLLQMRNTAGGQGYVQQNMYNILDINGGKDTNNKTTVTAPAVAAAMSPNGGMPGSVYVATNASTITAEVPVAIIQLAANQMQILQ